MHLVARDTIKFSPNARAENVTRYSRRHLDSHFGPSSFGHSRNRGTENNKETMSAG